MAAEVRRAVVEATPDGRVTTHGASVYVGVSEKTLANWRSLDRGPTFVKIGGAVTYRVEDLDAFIAAHDVTTATADRRERALVRPASDR